MTGANIDRLQESQKKIVIIKFRAFYFCRVSNFIKTEALATLAQNYCYQWIHHRPQLLPKRWQVPVLTGAKFVRRGESQKIIVTIKFTTLTLCGVRNFIKIEAFAVLHPKLWPDRWQLPTLTGVTNYKKTIPTSELTALDLWRVQNFIKIEAFVVLCPKLWPERWQVPTLAGVKNHRKLLSSINSEPSFCSVCKVSGKMVNLIPRSRFPFLKIALKNIK